MKAQLFNLEFGGKNVRGMGEKFLSLIRKSEMTGKRRQARKESLYLVVQRGV
jgi:hypothetical protein